MVRRYAGHRPTLLGIGICAAVTLVACGSNVSGTPEPAGTSEAPSVSSEAADLNALLVDPSVFPAPYEAIVLPPQAIAQASPDLTGIPAGAEVSPAGCKPKEVRAGEAALIVGTDNTDRATISVELTATDEPLSVRESQLAECAEVQATKSGATSTIRSTVVPAPPIDADDTLAVRQTVSSGTGSDTVTQSMLTLLAQVGDVRIAATYMSFEQGAIDGATLDEVFTAAVQKVKAG